MCVCVCVCGWVIVLFCLMAQLFFICSGAATGKRKKRKNLIETACCPIFLSPFVGCAVAHKHDDRRTDTRHAAFRWPFAPSLISILLVRSSRSAADLLAPPPPPVIIIIIAPSDRPEVAITHHHNKGKSQGKPTNKIIYLPTQIQSQYGY